MRNDKKIIPSSDICCFSCNYNLFYGFDTFLDHKYISICLLWNPSVYLVRKSSKTIIKTFNCIYIFIIFVIFQSPSRRTSKKFSVLMITPYFWQFSVQYDKTYIYWNYKKLLSHISGIFYL